MTTHGAFAIRKPIKVHKYLSRVRLALVADLAGEEKNLTAQQGILIDAVVDMLGILRMMGEYASEEGIMRGRDLQPCLLNSYPKYRNLVHKHLALLGIEHKEIIRDISPVEQADIIQAEVKASKKEDK